jgi:hypothetical protein
MGGEQAGVEGQAQGPQRWDVVFRGQWGRNVLSRMSLGAEGVQDCHSGLGSPQESRHLRRGTPFPLAMANGRGRSQVSVCVAGGLNG